MRVEYVELHQRRPCMRNREKGGKASRDADVLGTGVHAYLDGTVISTDTKGPPFRRIARSTSQPGTAPLPKAKVEGSRHALHKQEGPPVRTDWRA